MSAAERARELLKVAAGAEQTLRESVHELVTMRAWEVLRHENFSAMWLAENGYACPTQVQALAVEALVSEGINTAHSTKPPNGHTGVVIARFVGLPIESRSDRNVSERSTVARQMVVQILHGVPADRVRRGNSGASRAAIAEHGTVSHPNARPKPRRLGKSPDELVAEGFNLPRRDADEVAEVARQSNVPKAEIYRQAVAEYLDRLREAKKAAS